MDARYTIDDTSEIFSPALVVFRELLEDNIRRMLNIARDPARLRPHCKTHKMSRVIQLEAEFGITRHKAATIAECEMLAGAGVTDVLMSYPVVGPNIRRVVKFVEMYPDVAFAVLGDDSHAVSQLAAAMRAAGKSVSVFLDIDAGQHRTGLPVGSAAMDLYRQIHETTGLAPGGLHVYDGHQRQASRAERRQAVLAEWDRVLEFRDSLLRENLPVPRIVAGGTSTFPIYAEIDEPTLELSPGTCVFHDATYAERFPDLSFTPAALLLTRVISRPGPDRVTVDLGYKAVAADPPHGHRVLFPDLPDAQEVLHSEEHLVLKTARAGEFRPGDELLAIPRHICPTSALHKQVYVVAGGRVCEQWDVTARDRSLTI